jgi:hypothetical protein
MVELHFITNDSATQENITFLMIPAQMAVTDVQTVMPVLFHELFQNPSSLSAARFRPFDLFQSPG